jgi:integration host factor subunit beta
MDFLAKGSWRTFQRPAWENSDMTGEELNRLLAEKVNISQKKAKLVIDTMFECMADTLSRNERVDIRGFGTFKVKHYEGYLGRNPKTGEPVSVKPKKLPCFKVGKALKERMNTDSDA